VLDEEQLAEFAERGFVVVPQVIPPDLLRSATQAIERLIARRPPPAALRGPHHYFPDAAKLPPWRRCSRAARRWRSPSR
jgi:hypothetical protein